MLDLMKKINAPVLLVASSAVGTINHTMLSLIQLRKHGLDVMGVVMNGDKNSINKKAIEHYGNVNVVAEIEWINELYPTIFKNIFRKNFK